MHPTYPKTPLSSSTPRGTYSKTASNLNAHTTPDPIKDAYKLKSQIDAVEKSQQSFKTSEIIKIQTKLLTKAWKWISKYGIGSLNQYTKMKKQITNYDILINKMTLMQDMMQTNFNSLHRINKQHSLSLHSVQSNINKQLRQTRVDKQHIVSLLRNDTSSHEKTHHNHINGDLEEIEFPLTLKPLNENDQDHDIYDERMIILSKRLSPIIIRHSFSNGIESDVDSFYPKLPDGSPSSTAPSMMREESLVKEESFVKLNDQSMMKRNDHISNIHNSTSETFKREKVCDYMDFAMTEKEDMIVDEIMENLTMIETLSNDFNGFINNDIDKYKQETQQMIKSKLKHLHEILNQREMKFICDLKYLHKEKMIKLKVKQHKIQEHKVYLKNKLVECQSILQQYQTKWDKELNVLNKRSSSGYELNKLTKVTNIKMNLIRERTQHLTAIKNSVHQRFAIKTLERDIGNSKQMYIFTVSSADVHSIKEKLQSIGEIVDFATNYKNGELTTPKVLNGNKNGNAVGNNNNMGISVDIDENRKFSHLFNKKLHEFMGRKSNQSPFGIFNPSNPPSSVCSDSKMNLDHVNALDALSVSSADNDDDIKCKTVSDKFAHRKRTSVSVDTSASDVMTDLP